MTKLKAFFELNNMPYKIIFMLILLLIPLLVGESIGNAWVRTINFALLYIMLALGLNLIVGFAGLLNLGFIAFYAIGAYTYALLSSPQFDLHLPFYISIPIGALMAGLFGIILSAPILRLRGDYLAIVTLGFGEIIRIILNNTDTITRGAQGLIPVDPIKIGSFSFDSRINLFGFIWQNTYSYYYLLLLIVIITVIFCLRLQNSRVGRAWVAMREDDIAAQAMGINLRNMKLLAFALGTISGGISGGLFSAIQGYIDPTSFSLNESIIILTMVVLGGMGSIRGVILGAIILTLTPELLRVWVEPVQNMLFNQVLLPKENARMLLFGLAMVIMMILRPKGILPMKNRKIKLNIANSNQPQKLGDMQ